ncbi:MAG: HAMP domain-containing sensor histidine kinase [Pseudomonadota bacterium]
MGAGMMRLVWHSLSGRLLVLTIVFVMLAEVLIFVPSVARFRESWLNERVEKGLIAALAATEARDAMLTEDLQAEVLNRAGLFSVVLERDGRRQAILMKPMLGPVAATYDLRDLSAVMLIYDAFAAFRRTEDRLIRVIGEAGLTARPRQTGTASGGAEVPERMPFDLVEVVLQEGELRAAMGAFGQRILYLSLFISLLTAALVFLSVNAFLLRPIKRITDGIMRFREDPEDPSGVLRPSGARGEIGLAEQELALTQAEVVAALKQKSRLAALGEAVAKINHDLRNILASSQLLADRLETSTDPLVAKVGPKLIASLDRAIRLCQRTLTYGRAEEPPPDRRPVRLVDLADDVRAAVGLALRANAGSEGETPGIRFLTDIPPDLTADLDPDQMFRAIHNLARNACQALEAQGKPGVVRLRAAATEDGVLIELSDTGPGLPKKARENLFKAFKGSVRTGGSGLGLAIASELVRGHGGALTLEESGPDGCCFRITLPGSGPQEPTRRGLSQHLRLKGPSDAPQQGADARRQNAAEAPPRHAPKVDDRSPNQGET